MITDGQRSYGKVMFSVESVCLSTGGGGSHVTITHDALTSLYSPPARLPSYLQTWDLAIPGPRPLPASNIWWTSMETYSKLFTSGSQAVLTSGDYWCMYGELKRAARILLECFLVHSFIHIIALCSAEAV